MLFINNLTKQYKAGQPIFSDVSFTFEKGSGVGIIGPNGSGKTTFLRILSVNSFPTDGKVLFNEIDIHKNPHQYLSNVGLVHDEETLPRHLTAAELIEWVLRSRYMWDSSSESTMNTLLDKLNLDQRDEPIGTYSTGMKKKVQIAAAFIVKPQLYIMDEPLRGLDTTTRTTVLEMILDAKKEGALILMASHSMKSVDQIFDKIIEFPL
jgi:ABC-type multidrug transport system ATPase subunit